MAWVIFGIVVDLVALVLWIYWFILRKNVYKYTKPKITPGKPLYPEQPDGQGPVYGVQAKRPAPKARSFEDVIPYLTSYELRKIAAGCPDREREMIVEEALQRNRIYR